MSVYSKLLRAFKSGVHIMLLIAAGLFLSGPGAIAGERFECPKLRLCLSPEDYRTAMSMLPEGARDVPGVCQSMLTQYQGFCVTPKVVSEDPSLQRCPEMERYAVFLKDREKQGISVKAEEAKLEAAIISAEPYLRRGRMDLWCEHVTLNMR